MSRNLFNLSTKGLSTLKSGHGSSWSRPVTLLAKTYGNDGPLKFGGDTQATWQHSKKFGTSCRLSFAWDPRGSNPATDLLPIQPRSPRPTDSVFAQQLINFNTSRDLIEFVESSDTKLLDSRAIEVISRQLFEFFKNESDAAKKSAWASIGMQKYCRAIKKNARLMDPHTLVTVTKFLTVMKVSGSDQTYQIVLRLLSKHANNLELKQLIYLHFLLDQLGAESKSPIAEALTLALPVIFESQLSLQLDRSDPQELCECLTYAVDRFTSESSFLKLMSAIKGHIHHLNPKQAVRVLHSVIDYPRPVQDVEQYVNPLFHHLSSFSDTLSAKEICSMINKCVKYYKRSGNVPSDFLGASIDQLLQLNDKQAILNSYKSISILRHIHVEHLEALAEIILEEPKALLNDEGLYYGLVRTYSSASYKPEVWDRLEPLLVEHPSLTKDVLSRDIPLALDFLAIGIAPVSLVDKIFAPSYAPKLDEWLARNGAKTLVTLYLALKQLHPDYAGNLPSQSSVEKWSESVELQMQKLASYPFKLAIQSCCGGEEYVANGLMLEGIFIDHAVAIKKDGTPVQVRNHDFELMKTVAEAEDASIVFVKTYGKEAFASNTRRLRGIYNLEHKIIERFGYPCIRISATEWRVLNEEDKGIFFTEKIKEHTGQMIVKS